MSGFKISNDISTKAKSADSANSKVDTILENGYKLYSKSKPQSNSTYFFTDSLNYDEPRVFYGGNTFYPNLNSIFIPKTDLLKHTITFDVYGTFLFRNIDVPIIPLPPSDIGPKITFGVKFSTINSLLGSITTRNVVPRPITWPSPDVGNWRYTLTVTATPNSNTDTYACSFIATLMESGFDGVWSSQSVMSNYTANDALANIENAELYFVADGNDFPSQNINDVVYITKRGHTVHRVG
jgi:hypothetical protein